MYLEVDEGFYAHRKTLRFCALMQNTEAWSHILRLWGWACRSAPTGDLSGMEPAEVEIAMGWRSMDGRAYAAAVLAGFIDEASPGRPVAIHGWDEHTGGAIKRMEEAAARKAAWRAAHKPKPGQVSAVHGTETGQRQDEDAMSSGQTDTVQSSPVQTRQDKSPEGDARARDPVARTVTGRDLSETFARLRAETYPGTLPWNTSGLKPEKASRMADFFGEHPEAIPDIEPTMRLLLARGLESQDPRDREASFAFGCWCARFTDLVEDLRGLKPRSAAENARELCEFHRRPGSAGKAALKHLFRASCPECRHVQIRGSPRRSSDPTSIAALIPNLGVKP